MCFPIDELLRGALWTQTPADIPLMASETMSAFLFIFFHLRGAIHRQGYPPVISLHRQWLPDTSAPCKRCRHLSISSGWGHTRMKRAHAHKSNLSPESNPILLFFRQSWRESECCWGETYTGKVITISGSFGVTRRPHRLSCSSPTHHFGTEARFQSLYSRRPSFTKLLTAKSKWILWVIACCERSNLIFSAASRRHLNEQTLHLELHRRMQGCSIFFSNAVFEWATSFTSSLNPEYCVVGLPYGFSSDPCFYLTDFCLNILRLLDLREKTRHSIHECDTCVEYFLIAGLIQLWLCLFIAPQRQILPLPCRWELIFFFSL